MESDSRTNKIYSILEIIKNIIKEVVSQLRSLLSGGDKPQETSSLETEFLKLENNKKNMVYSPLSIKYALSMLNEGANGNTKKQIEKVLGDKNLGKYNNIDKILSLANSVYIREEFKEDIKESYKKQLEEKYNAEVNYDAFKNADNINNWIENKTFGRIKDMLSDDIVQDSENMMVLINALALDMEWEDNFDAEDTGGAEFFLEDGSSMNATTLKKETKSDSMSYYKDDEVTALRINLKEYENTQLEFVAVMPKEKLSNYIEEFNMDDLDNVIEKSKLASETKAGLYVTVPRFSVEYDLNLKEDLIKLGITDAFNFELADFSNMSNKKIFVGDALHKANIDFTEKGIKAAAATVIFIKDGMALKDDEPERIIINKPFLYVIRDKETGEIWFTGTVYEPNSWEEDKANYEYR
ncbi:MAG: hypothetical protein IJN50_04650 [Clostridia bacterium]|nr:hypothetical protein [Clostridia bacterium]